MPPRDVSGAVLDNGRVRVVVAVDDEGRAALAVAPSDAPDRSSWPATSLPHADLVVDGEGTGWAGTRSVATTVGSRLRVRDVASDGRGVRVESLDDVTGLVVRTEVTTVDGVGAVRASTTVRNDGGRPVTLRAVSSAVLGLPGIGRESVDQVEIVRGRNDWLGENRWTRGPVRRSGLPDLYRGVDPATPIRLRGAVRASSSSSWSTVEELPVAALVRSADGPSWMWQVEHNGPWSWQVGEHGGGLYLALSGPAEAEHHWSHELAPGDVFTAVPVTVAVAGHGLTEVVAEMTTARRHARERRDPQLPVVFNDYMNTLMGDPSSERLLPLVDAAADVGADVFVIDAGWYADDGDWWDAVGEWQPSTRRFPDGLDAVLAHIRDRGMVAGLWLEPEVVGLRSPMADKLPPEAFLSRNGHRWVEDGRYHLDLAHPAAREHLDEVVDRLVDDLSVGYFKLDYNIRAGVGTDRDTRSVGDGLLRHNLAHLAWIDDVRARHPRLLLENCASGAMRQDAAQLQRHDLQSTSDQEDAELYPPIAAGAPMMVPPDQAASWAYPQPDMTDEQIAFTLVTGLAGRLYLSGFLDGMSRDQRGLVRAAVALHRDRRTLLTRGVPAWPLGLPSWDDPWVASALVDAVDGTCAVNVWKRAGAPSRTRLALPAPPAGRRWAAATAVFPDRATGATWTYDLDDHGGLDVGCTDDVASARVVMVTSEPRP